jgi:hypothetical protein
MILGVAGFHYIDPFGHGWALLAVLAGIIIGWFAGPMFGLLFLLPFEGISRLVRFIRHGCWTGDTQHIPQEAQQVAASNGDKRP